MNLWGMVRFGITSRVSSTGAQDAIRSTPAQTGQQQGQDTIVRYPPWGFESRMPVGGLVVCVSPQGGSNVAQIGGRHDKYKPDYDDAEWTQTLYNEVSGTWVKLRKDGGVQVRGKDSLFELKANGTAKWTSAGGASVELTGDTIKLNGGSIKANRQGDPVIAAAGMVTWMSQVATFINGIAPGTVAPPAPPNFGVTDGGNPKITMT